VWRKSTYYRLASVAAISTLPVACALLGAPGAGAATCAADPCDLHVATIQQAPDSSAPSGTFSGFTTTDIPAPTYGAPTSRFSGSTNFEPGLGINASSSSGPPMNISDRPSSLIQISQISGSTFFPLGSTSGGTAPDQSFTICTAGDCAALPLFATGLGGLGLLGWRRKRKARASVA